MDNDKIKAKLRFKEWKHYALEDEEIIKIALKEDGPANQICLHSEQMVEKYLKGYLSYQKHKLLKIHQLDKLLLECKKYDKSFSKLSKEALKLSDYYIETRYPGDYFECSRKEAEEAYRMAKKIKRFILSKI